MNEINQEIVLNLMSKSKRVFDSEVPANWDADIFADANGYFGVVTSYPIQTVFIHDFVRISDKQYAEIVSEISDYEPGYEVGIFLQKCFEQIHEKNMSLADRILDAEMQMIRPEQDDMTHSEQANKFSLLSIKAFSLSNRKTELNQFYASLVFDDLSSHFWNKAVEAFESAYMKGEFKNAQMRH
jgi:hypothetical protein